MAKHNPVKYIKATCAVPHENSFLKTYLVKKYGGFDENRRYAVEIRLWLRLIRNYTPLFVDENFAVSVSHKGSATNSSIFFFFKRYKRRYGSLQV
jgi:hypothetical protein